MNATSESVDDAYWQVITVTDLPTMQAVEAALGDLPLSTSVFKAEDGRWRVLNVTRLTVDEAAIQAMLEAFAQPWVPAEALATGFLDHDAEARRAQTALQRALGPLASVAASVEWVRYQVTLNKTFFNSPLYD